MTRYPHYLQEKAPGRYHFRVVVPPGLRAYIGQRGLINPSAVLSILAARAEIKSTGACINS